VIAPGRRPARGVSARLGCVVQVPDHMARTAVEAGRLEEVLARFRGAPIPISVGYPGSHQVPSRLRVFIGALVALRSTGRRGGRTSP
jgi:DNA-binding transcriptional LysR family regulator